MRHFACVLLLACSAAASENATTATPAANATAAKAPPMTVQLEVPVGNRSVTIKATEGEDFQRLGELFVKKFEEELANTQITPDAIVRGIQQLIESGYKTRAERAAAAANKTAPAYSAQLTVNLGSKGKQQILISEGDDPVQLARAFCVRHGLGQDVFEKVAQSLNVLLQEAKLRGEAEAELEHADEHYMNALGCFVALVAVLKLVFLLKRGLVGVYQRRQFEQGHAKAKRADFLQKWDDTQKAPVAKKGSKNRGKSGNSPGTKAKVQ